MVEEIESRLRGKGDPDESPPVFATWPRFYAVVIINTLFVYLLLLLFSYFAAR